MCRRVPFVDSSPLSQSQSGRSGGRIPSFLAEGRAAGDCPGPWQCRFGMESDRLAGVEKDSVIKIDNLVDVFGSESGWSFGDCT